MSEQACLLLSPTRIAFRKVCAKRSSSLPLFSPSLLFSPFFLPLRVSGLFSPFSHLVTYVVHLGMCQNLMETTTQNRTACVVLELVLYVPWRFNE